MAGSRKNKMEVKVYLVMERVNVGSDANERVIAARLTRGAAQEIVDKRLGTYILKMIATK